MKNYKQLVEEYNKKHFTFPDSYRADELRAFATWLDSLPDQEPKDLPKLPEKLEIDSWETPWTLMPVIKTINQILDYLKNNSN